ncbi:c-type cytochrome [Oceaniglobus indicus]|uniref:c-type cytochrome n=1 Tax=Oceaniglobus indicus TaxID=2047749 RepID=UPI000C194180|nr:cytochrome c [Oceaniglobus indicus]
MNRTLVAIAALLLVTGAAIYWTATGPALQGPGHSMVPPDTGAIADGAPLVTVALPGELSPDAQIGKRAFTAKCAACHGVNAAGQNGVAPPLVHKIYEPSHHSDMAFVLAARNGVRAHHWTFGNMPAVDGLTDADVKLIARYVRELQQENGIF